MVQCAGGPAHNYLVRGVPQRCCALCYVGAALDVILGLPPPDPLLATHGLLDWVLARGRVPA